MKHRIGPDPSHPGKFAVFLDDKVVEGDLSCEDEAKEVSEMLEASS